MGESELITDLASESELIVYSGKVADAWRRARCFPLVVGLTGELGAGKTTWVRGMLRGLGHVGKVPSPTYTLLEHYDLGALNVVHLDLYRLGGDEELENLGLRDWLESPASWVLVEWPERAPRLAARCDVRLTLALTGPTARRATLVAHTAIGNEALRACRQLSSK
jgi:tRNA threonylcarbamoyladenosine biosynthesis protein TsaE